MTNSSSGELSNPFSTGGGGTTFEQLIGTYYLVSLLASDIPRGLSEGICQKVAFQQRWDDAILDDIVVTTRLSDATERQLMLQVKHDITVGDNNLFRRVMSDCWITFDVQRGNFNPLHDRIGIATGVYHTKVDKHLQRLLQWARTSISVEEFQRVQIEGFSSSEMREYLHIFEKVLSEAAGQPISKQELWQFLKCFVYIHFDFEHEGGRDTEYIQYRSLDQLDNRSSEEAIKLVGTLQKVVSEYAKSGGSIDSPTLRAKLNVYSLKDRIDCAHDLERLRDHSSRTLSRINTTIGQKVHLPRAAVFEEILEAIQNNQIVIILGEPGAGKSALLHAAVDCLRQEGEVLVTSIDNLSGGSIEEFTANLRIDYDFRTLLGAFSAAPFRGLFINQLEQALLDEKQRNVLYDLIHEVREFNAEISRKNLPNTNQWRVVATCRADQYYSLLPSLKQNFGTSSFKEIHVPLLEINDVEIVVDAFPSLQHLSKQQHVQELLRNPFVLNFLTFPDLDLVALPKPEMLTESWLVDLYWSQVIRNAEKASTGKGHPDAREKTAIMLGELRLQNGRKPIPSSELDPEIIGALAHDKVVHREEGRITFAHDILDDWTISRILLSRRDNLVSYLRKNQEALLLIKPLRLIALQQLELKQAADDWIDLLAVIKGDSQLALRWHQTVLAAPLLSPMLDGLLEIIEPRLFTETGILLTDLIRVLRTVCTAPNKSITELLQKTNLTKAEFEKQLAWAREPIVEQWVPIWMLLFKHRDNLPVQSLPEIVEAAYMWMKQENIPLRKEVGLFCLTILDKDFQKKLRDGYYTDDYVVYSSHEGWIDEKVVRQLQRAVFAGADCIQQEVKNLLYNLLDKNDSYLAQLLFGRDHILTWAPIAKHLPDIFVDITLKIFCDTREIEVNEFDDILSRKLFRETGIRHDHIWRFPTNFKEDTPFYYFLNMNPNYGIKLIVELVNFATQKWVEIQRADKRTPLPQNIMLSPGKHDFWGDHDVYNWCLEVPPKTVGLALRSLRYWLDEYFKLREQDDPARVFEIVLSQSCSFAIVSLCVLVASEDINKRAAALLPILEQPAFWEIDRFRLAQMMTFGNRDNLYTFTQLTQFILLAGKSEDRERLQKALRQFPETPPFFVEEEKKNIDLVRARTERMEELATLADPENYTTSDHEEGVIIEFNYPEEIATRYQKKAAMLKEYQDVTNLQGWAHLMASGKVSDQFSPDNAMKLVQELDASVTDRNQDVDKKTVVIAEVCAAFVIQHYEWLVAHNYLDWCRQKIFEAVYHEDDETGLPSPFTGISHAMPKALPSLIVNNPEDVEAREAILHLIWYSDRHSDAYAVQHLFEELSSLWQVDSDYVWQCFNLLVEKAKAIRKYTQKRQKSAPDDTSEAEEVELTTDIPKISGLSFDHIYLLHPLVRAMPQMLDEGFDNLRPDLLVFFDEIIAFNNKVNKHSQMTQMSRKHQFFQVPRDWGEPFYKLLTDWMLHLPFEIAEQHILKPIILIWEDAFEPLEKLLGSILFSAKDQKYEARIIQIWQLTIPAILNTDAVKNHPVGWHKAETENTLSCLLLIDRYGFDIWKELDWNPAPQLANEFDLWVETVGHYPANFATLIRMLRIIGSPLALSHGIDWVTQCFQKANDRDKLFKSDATLSALAGFLFDLWQQNESELTSKHELLQRYMALVDYLAARGAQLAVEIQRKTHK
jgi:hypothetical protein